MPDIASTDWSERDDRNSETVPAGWPPGTMPAYVDQTGRMMMGAIKRSWNKMNPVYLTGGTGDNYVVTTQGNTDTINLYEIVRVRIDRSNTTTTPTLKYGSTTARTILKGSPSGLIPLAVGDLYAGNAHSLWCNGPNYILTDPAAGALPTAIVPNTILVANGTGTAYLPETAAQVRGFLNLDEVTPGQYGAAGDGVTNDDTPTHAAATGAGLGGTVNLPQGKRFKVSNLDFGPQATHFDGAGSYGTVETYGFWKRNSYADKPGLRSVYFPEYQTYVNRSILGSSASQGSPLNTIVGYLRGDSQTHGGFGEYVKLEAAMTKALTVVTGIPNIFIGNLAISGTRWSQLLDGSASQLPSNYTGVSFTMLGFGANDLDYYDFPTMIGYADAALAFIRGSTGGGFGTHTIYLRVPNAMTYGPAVFGNGLSRNEELSELFLQAYLHLGRKYQCVVWDAYGNFRDARTGVNYTFDNAFGDGRAIHPINDMSEVICAQFVREAFPREQFGRVATNTFENHGAVSSSITAAILPNQFRNQQWYRATVANGFPFEGAVFVNTNVDGPAIQTLVGYANGVNRIATRTAYLTGPVWNPWTGVPSVLTYANSWVDQSASSSGDAPSASILGQDGMVYLSGGVKSGTTTAGTIFAVVAAGHRPGFTRRFTVNGNGGLVRVAVFANGNIALLSTGDATLTSLDGICYPVAGVA